MAASLDGPFAKIDRAKEHLALLDEETAAFFEGQPIELLGQFEPDTSEYVFRAKVLREPPARLGVIVGDFAHNLRSALEHLTYQLVLLAENEALWSRCHQFPTLATSRADFAGQAPRNLAGIDPNHIATIERAQPYNASDPDAHVLAILNWLTREDKHKLVHPTVGFIRPDRQPNLRFTANHDAGAIRQRWIARSRRVQDGADVVRIKLAPLGTKPEMQMHGQLPLDIAFGERALRGTALQEIEAWVRAFIEGFAGDFA